MKIYRSYSSEETKKIAATFAKRILKLKKRRRDAIVVALTGNLGSGKTTFVQGFLRALGVRGKITSPTFVLVKRYAIRAKRFTSLYHADAYRLRKPADFKTLGLKEIISSPQNMVLVEWAEKVEKLLPKSAVWIKFSHGEKEKERKMRI